jgi:hypothetical protein
VPTGTDGINYSKQMVAKIDTEWGRKIYPQRLGLIEPVFANIRVHKRLDRFTLRGKVKVNIQWTFPRFLTRGELSYWKDGYRREKRSGNGGSSCGRRVSE